MGKKLLGYISIFCFVISILLLGISFINNYRLWFLVYPAVGIMVAGTILGYLSSKSTFIGKLGFVTGAVILAIIIGIVIALILIFGF